MSASITPSKQLISEILELRRENKGLTFHVLKEAAEEAGFYPEVDQYISNVQKFSNESSQFKADASSVKDGKISIEQIKLEENEVVQSMDSAANAILALFKRMKDLDGQQKNLYKVIILELCYTYWEGYEEAQHAVTVITLTSNNEGYKQAFNNAIKQDRIATALKLCKENDVDQDYSNNMHKRFEKVSYV